MDLPVGIATLQNTDRWVGVPLCALLTLVRRITGPAAPVITKPRKILFVKFAEQGSTVLAYPAIRRAADLVGRENVYFVVFEDNRFILDVMEIIPEENVITIGTQSPFVLARGALRAVRRARKLGIDAAIDMEFFTRFSAMLTFLSGARARVGFHSWFGDGPYRGDLMTHRLLYNPHLHTSEMFEAMAEALTRNPATLPTFDFKPAVPQTFGTFTARPGESAELEAILQRETPKLGAGPIILLNPNASDLLPLRRWPPARYTELAQRLLQRYPDLFVGFTGAPSEAPAINQLARDVGSERAIGLAGKTTLRQLLVLYARSTILVTNDSGPAHFASLTPIHVVTLFGPETPALFAARSPRASVIWKGIACSPCVNAYNNRQSVCRDNVCMQGITVDEVFERVTRIYDAR
ncbi:MAG: glycosyltransferase family 9 protein [Verrucomicrobiota bacterium]|nr:glycosyltransferase family 9 protein [Verrucomicrobiota bacterium]